MLENDTFSRIAALFWKIMKDFNNENSLGTISVHYMIVEYFIIKYIYKE